MARFIDADNLLEYLHKLDGYEHISMIAVRQIIEAEETADVREVIEADGYQHLICPHCLSEFYSKTKAEMFAPIVGKVFLFRKVVRFC